MSERERERNCPIDTDAMIVCLVCCSPVDVLRTGVEVDVDLTACDSENESTVPVALLYSLVEDTSITQKRMVS